MGSWQKLDQIGNSTQSCSFGGEFFYSRRVAIGDSARATRKVPRRQKIGQNQCCARFELRLGLVVGWVGKVGFYPGLRVNIRDLDWWVG